MIASQVILVKPLPVSFLDKLDLDSTRYFQKNPQPEKKHIFYWEFPAYKNPRRDG